jgi:hypothetical protein
LLNVFYAGAQPIDAHLFGDDDGQIYLYYGGWRHLVVMKMNDTMDGFKEMEEPAINGVAREITPENYVEAPYVQKIDGKYNLMYSTGNWTDGTYAVPDDTQAMLSGAIYRPKHIERLIVPDSLLYISPTAIIATADHPLTVVCSRDSAAAAYVEKYGEMYHLTVEFTD